MATKNKIGVLIFFLIIMSLAPAKAQFYEISLLTCDPGDQLYSSFGHSAIRVREIGSEGRDMVFNFGTFDFDTPNFYGKFATGKLNYMLSVTTYDRFVIEYDYFKRGMREQVLNMTLDQKDLLVQHLDALYDPARRFYKYDFFFNNCATKIRDAFEIAMGKQLVWNDSAVVEEKTFRNLIDEYVHPLPWADLGIDLALGSVIDRNATEREKQFLPDYMEQAFARATVLGDGPSRPFVKETRVILEYPEQEKSMDLLNPYIVLWALAIGYGILTFFGFRKGKLYKGLDVGLFSLLGLIGVVVTFLWFFTDHSATLWNWNILWAFPGHLVLAWVLVKGSGKTWISKYLLFVLIATVVALVIWIAGIQSFHPSLVPLFLIILLRANFLFYNLERLAQKA
jgi:heme/copper-type cytochrome/quinol oxidase subunit 4